MLSRQPVAEVAVDERVVVRTACHFVDNSRDPLRRNEHGQLRQLGLLPALQHGARDRDVQWIQRALQLVGMQAGQAPQRGLSRGEEGGVCLDNRRCRGSLACGCGGLLLLVVVHVKAHATCAGLPLLPLLCGAHGMDSGVLCEPEGDCTWTACRRNRGWLL
jgi:hypothetical protein